MIEDGSGYFTAGKMMSLQEKDIIQGICTETGKSFVFEAFSF